MKAPPFDKLRMHFPDTDSVTPDELYQWIGYLENITNPRNQGCGVLSPVELDQDTGP